MRSPGGQEPTWRSSWVRPGLAVYRSWPTDVWAGPLRSEGCTGPGLGCGAGSGGCCFRPHGTWGRGARAETPLCQPGCWPLLSSKPALPPLGNHGSSSACGLRLPLLSPVPEAPTQGGPTVSGTLGTGSQEEARAGELFWLRRSASMGPGPGPSFALCPVKRCYQVCVPVWLASQDCRSHPVR